MRLSFFQLLVERISFVCSRQSHQIPVLNKSDWCFCLKHLFLFNNDVFCSRRPSCWPLHLILGNMVCKFWLWLSHLLFTQPKRFSDGSCLICADFFFALRFVRKLIFNQTAWHLSLKSGVNRLSHVLGGSKVWSAKAKEWFIFSIDTIIILWGSTSLWGLLPFLMTHTYPKHMKFSSPVIVATLKRASSNNQV